MTRKETCKRSNCFKQYSCDDPNTESEINDNDFKKIYKKFPQLSFQVKNVSTFAKMLDKQEKLLISTHLFAGKQTGEKSILKITWERLGTAAGNQNCITQMNSTRNYREQTAVGQRGKFQTSQNKLASFTGNVSEKVLLKRRSEIPTLPGRQGWRKFFELNTFDRQPNEDHCYRSGRLARNNNSQTLVLKRNY